MKAKVKKMQSPFKYSLVEVCGLTFLVVCSSLFGFFGAYSSFSEEAAKQHLNPSPSVTSHRASTPTPSPNDDDANVASNFSGPSEDGNSNAASLDPLTGPSPEPTVDAPSLSVTDIDGKWIIYWGTDGQHEAVLEIRAGQGKFSAPMPYTVYQRLTPKGNDVYSPDTPVIKGTKIPAPNFDPDHLRFITNPGSSTVIQTMDGKGYKDWQDVHEEKSSLSSDNRQYDAEVTFPGGNSYTLRCTLDNNGILTLAELETQIVRQVNQQARAQVVDESIVVSCYKPILANTGFTAPSYTKDTFRFRRGTTGFIVDRKDDQDANWVENIKVKNWYQ